MHHANFQNRNSRGEFSGGLMCGTGGARPPSNQHGNYGGTPYNPSGMGGPMGGMGMGGGYNPFGGMGGMGGMGNNVYSMYS